MSQFTQAEKAVVDRLASHVATQNVVSLTQLADECHVSKSTVVKALKKLGYNGYDEFACTFRIRSHHGKGGLVPQVLVVGDQDQHVEAVVRLLTDNAEKKNVVFASGEDTASLIASYLSRKLAFFDIFMPVTYDLEMVDNPRLERGFALFILHAGILQRRSTRDTHRHAGEQLMRRARERGFTIMTVADQDFEGLPLIPDLDLRIPTNDTVDLDLFASRVISLFECSLSRYAFMTLGRNGDA